MANGNEFAELEIVVRGNRRELDKFEKDVKGSAANVEKSFKQSADKTERRYKRMFGSLRSGFNRLQKSAKRVGKQMQRVGRSLSTFVTAPLTILAGASVKAFADFDAAMTKSLAIMGDVSQAMRRDMSDAAREVAKTTTLSATEAAESYFFLASAGLNTEQSLAALPRVAAFAQAGMFDMATATDLATDAQSALGLTVEGTQENLENLNRVTDVLVKANTLSNATVEQFSTSLTREAGSALKSFNKDIEEGVAVLAAFADQGIKGEIAGTGLSRIIRLMTQAANNNQEAMDQLGIRVFDAEGRMRNLADIIGNLETALSGMSDQQRTAALEAIGFTARVQGMILPLLGTSDSIREYEDALRDAGGTTDEIAKNQLQGFSAQLGLLKDNLIDIGIAIGQDLEPTLRDMVDTTGNVVEWFQNLDDGTRKMIIVMGGLAAAIGPVLLVVGTLSIAIAAISAPVALAVVAFGSLAAAGYQLWQNWDFLAGEASRIWNAIVETIRSALDAFVGFIEDAINAAVKAFNFLGRQLARIPGVTHQAAEEFEFAANKGQELSVALGGVNKEAGKGQLNFTRLAESGQKAREETDKWVDDTLDDFRSKVGEAWKQSALMSLESNKLANILGVLTDETEKNTKATKENEEEKGENGDTTEDAISAAEQFSRTLREQKSDLEQSIGAYKLAHDTTLTYESAMKVLEARALGFGESLDGLIRRIQELNEAEQFEAEFFKAFGDLETIDTTGWEIVFPDPEEEGRDRGETFGESLTKGMLDEVRNNLANVLRGDLTNIFSNLAKGVGQVFSQILSNELTKGFFNDKDEFTLSGGLKNIANLGKSMFGRAGLGAGIGNMIGGIPGAIGGGLGGIGGGLLGSSISGAATSALGATIGSAVPVIGTAIGAVLGGFLGKALGGLFSDRARFDVEVFNIGNEREIAENLANGITFAVSDVIRLGFDEAFRTEQIFVKGKGGAEDIAEAEQIRQQVTDSLNNTVDRIFGIINQLPSDMATMLRDTFRNTELVFDQLIDDASLEFDEGSSDIEDVQKRWQQFIEADLPARFLTTIGDFFTSTIQGLGVNAEAAQSFVNDRLEEIKNTESRELRGQLGEEFLQDFQRFVTAFNFAQGNLGGAVDQSINQLRTLAESIEGISGESLPSIDSLQRLTQELLATGDVTQETLDSILQLRSGIVQLGFSLTGAIGDLTDFIDTLNADIVELGGSRVGTGGARRQAIDTLLGLAETEGLSLEERQQALQQANQQIDAFVQSQLQAQQQQVNQEAELIGTRIEGLNEEKERIEEAANIRLEALREELRIAELQESLVRNIEDNIQDLLFSSQSPESAFQQLARAESQLGQLASQFGSATGEDRVRVGEQIQELLNTRLDVSGRAFQQPSLEFRDAFRSTILGLEELKQEMEPVRSVEEINAEILQQEQILNERLSFIDQRIEMMRQEQNALQEQANQLSGEIAAEVREMKERIRVQAEEILDQRLQQLQESGLSEIGIQQGQLSTLEQIRDILASPDKGTGGGRAPLPTGGVTGGTVGNTGFQGGFQSFSSFADGSGGFRNFGSGTPAVLHGVEAVVRPNDIRSGNTFHIGSLVTIQGNVDSDERLDQVQNIVRREFHKMVNFDPTARREIGRIKAS